MQSLFWLAFLAAVTPAADPTRDLEAGLHDLRVAYALAADIEAYRAAHNRLPAVKDVSELARVVGLSHPKFGTSDAWNTPLFVESDPASNRYTVAVAGSDKAFDRATWSTAAQTRSNADDIVIRDGKIIRSSEAWVSEMLRTRGFEMGPALIAARTDNAAIHTEFAMSRLNDVINDYFAEHHDYPALETLRKLAVEKAVNKLEDPMVDGWGTPFRFRFTPQPRSYRIVSAGSNKTFEETQWGETNTTSDYSRDLVLLNGTFVGTWKTHPDDDIVAEGADDLEQVRAKFAALVSGTPKERQASRLSGLMDEARDAMKAGDVVTALAKYEEALKLDPSFVDADTLSFIANSLTGPVASTFPPPPPRTGKPLQTIQNDPAMRAAAPRVVALLRPLVDAKPNNFDFVASLAALQRDLGDAAAARATIERYAAAHPDDLRIYLLRTRISAEPGDFDKAVRAFDAAVTNPKNDSEALYAAGILGYAMVAHGDVPPAPRAMILRDARKILERAIALKPDYFEAMAYLNLVLRQQAQDETDPAKQKALTDEADRVRSSAMEIIKRKKG
jgi:tetratricopeptide (TPR) repeat protein